MKAPPYITITHERDAALDNYYWSKSKSDFQRSTTTAVVDRRPAGVDIDLIPSRQPKPCRQGQVSPADYMMAVGLEKRERRARSGRNTDENGHEVAGQTADNFLRRLVLSSPS